MKINRYKWTPQGMVYDRFGEWMGVAAHEAVVTFAETERTTLVTTSEARATSLEAAVVDKDDELDAARKRIEDLEVTASLPIDPIKVTKP